MEKGIMVFQFTPETVAELRAAFKAGGEAGIREVLEKVRPDMTEEEISAIVRGLEEEARAAQVAAAQSKPEPAPAASAPATVEPQQDDPFFGDQDPFRITAPDPFKVTQEMAPVREPEPAAQPEPAPAARQDDEEPEEIRPEDVTPLPPPYPNDREEEPEEEEEGRQRPINPVKVALVALAVVLVIIAVIAGIRACGGQSEEPAATAPVETVATETVLTIDQEQAIAACEARFAGYLTHDECVKAVQER